MREKELEEKLIKNVRKKGGVAYKWVSPGRAGVPDRIVILPKGKISFVEVKKPGQGKLRKIQEHEIKKLADLGCKCYVLKDESEIEQILTET